MNVLLCDERAADFLASATEIKLNQKLVRRVGLVITCNDGFFYGNM